MSSRPFDITIIGGGIVGTATGMILSRLPNVSLLLLEAEEGLAAHQTGHNSGVIHSGLYYRPGSLKAVNCTLGREALYRFCAEQEIPHDRCGKIVVATRPEELAPLDQLAERGAQNGLTDLRRLGPEEIRELEPHIDGIAGLHVPQTGIVDFTAVTRRYAELFEHNGGHLRLNTRLRKCVRDGTELVLSTTQGEFRSRYLINCGGLQADRIARLCGLNPGLKIVPFRGEYYELRPDRRGLVRNLVYPVPDPRYPFLGVHFTRMIDAGVEAGPNAVLAFKREGYGRCSISFPDTASFLFYRGFWKMAFKYWRTGLGETWRSWSKRAFVAALRRLMPELQLGDVQRGGAGVRAQALLPTGQLCDDFRIEVTEQMIHVLNAPSPAATSSLNIGQTITELAQKQFTLH